MSMPTIPDITPTITLSRDDSINLLLSSIAFEELGLSHIINAEAEKIQYIIGTGPIQPPTQATIAETIQINETVERALRNVIKKEMLLQFKLEDVLNIEVPVTPVP